MKETFIMDSLAEMEQSLTATEILIKDHLVRENITDMDSSIGRKAVFTEVAIRVDLEKDSVY